MSETVRATIVVALIAALGCATAPLDGPTLPTPTEEPVTLESQVESAAQLAADAPTQSIRYNPVKCTCPPFELALTNRWVRVELDGMDDPESAAARLLARARQEEERDPPAVYSVTGDLSTSTRRCGQGALYLVLAIETVE